MNSLLRGRRRLRQQALQLRKHALLQVLKLQEAAAKSTAGRTPLIEDPTDEEAPPVATLMPE